MLWRSKHLFIFILLSRVAVGCPPHQQRPRPSNPPCADCGCAPVCWLVNWELTCSCSRVFWPPSFAFEGPTPNPQTLLLATQNTWQHSAPHLQHWPLCVCRRHFATLAVAVWGAVAFACVSPFTFRSATCSRLLCEQLAQQHWTLRCEPRCVVSVPPLCST